MRAVPALMADSVRSPFDYREPPTLDSDGDGGRPALLRGRKRKGTPVKVCERYVTEDEEESLSEHSFSPGDERFGEGPEERLLYLTDSTQLCEPDLGEAGVRGPVLFHPPPNCRIREVHCGSQVRLVVMAIRDIAKGEEITVDYSLSEWSENTLGFHGSVSPQAFDCGFSTDNTIKKEEEPDSHPLSLNVSDYLTPSWSLSPSSSPVSHSEGSDSEEEDEEDDEDEDEEEEEDDEEEELEQLRGQMMKRRKKRKNSVSVKKKMQTRPSSFTRPSPTPSFQPPPPPTTNINNNININIGRGSGGGGGGSSLSQRQLCPHCNRHFRSLARHLEKHHAQQAEPTTFPPPSPLSSSSVRTPPFSRERGSVSTTPKPAAVSFSLSLSPSLPKAASPTHPIATPSRNRPPSRRGRPSKKVKEEAPRKRLQQERAEEREVTEEPKKEEAPVSVHHQEKEKEEEEEEEEEEAAKSGEVAISHAPPLLSSLSTLVQYLRRQQRSSFLVLSRVSGSPGAWRQLCHSSLALLILFNRQRECEVSRLSVQEYRARATPSPLDASLSSFERQVLHRLPRAAVLGKRGRLQPLILPPGAEACLDLLLRTAPDVGVDPASPYVFSRPYHSPATPLRGTDLLRTLARASRAENPASLTAPRARRQVAILTQLLMLEEAETAGGDSAHCLEDFLQKEYHVTQSCAGLQRDLELMGRVARVVLYGERDGVMFRGMSLQHICLELDVMSGHSADSGESEREEQQTTSRKEEEEEEEEEPKRPTSSRSRKKKPLATPPLPRPHALKRRSSPVKSGKRGVLKRPWTEAERAAVETHLQQHITQLRVPAKAECERCLQLCPLLVSNQRDWRAIKFYCHNRIQLLRKQSRG